ncbi:MAG: D-glycero-beta-D-manno-heptose-7-phosphate kinase [Candidatus Neomarinimicrobiota bacterium]
MIPTRYQELEAGFSSKTVMVIGDLMLDNYLWGDAQRISPEAPVPVVRLKSSSSNPGGAANVAYNLSSLGARTILCGVVGDDSDGGLLRSILKDMEVNTGGIVVDPGRPTTVKTRIIARGHHVVRTDWEDASPIAGEVKKVLLERVKQHLGDADAVILEDYNKGLLSGETIARLITLFETKSVPVYADPKHHNFFNYKNVVMVKPNLEEASRALGSGLSPEENLEQTGSDLRKKLGCHLLLITKGDRGMSLFDESGHHPIPTRTRRVHDVSGAGDTVMAVFCLAHLSGASPLEAATVANYAAGRVCEEVGVVPITKETLHEIITHHSS